MMDKNETKPQQKETSLNSSKSRCYANWNDERIGIGNPTVVFHHIYLVISGWVDRLDLGYAQLTTSLVHCVCVD